jgi:hypothetical protein
MATLVQILIAAILSFLGMNPNAQERMADKKGTVIEEAFQTHNFLLPAEKNECLKWESITINLINCDYDS